MVKRFIWLLVICIVIAIIYYHQLIGYGIAQAKGQFNVLWNAEPIEEVISRTSTPDTIREKLALIKKIRLFAFDSLGLKKNKNYTTYYNQHGKEILWVVTGCAPYKFEPVEWSFPIIGSFTYKGFFELDKALALAKELKEKGYDVEVSSVTGWSTLGWFKDPVLSNMLEGSVGSMANTIIHELTHGTIFVPDSMTFNENLASFVGRKGGVEFLEKTYGKESEQVISYKNRLSDSERFTRFMKKGASQLDSIYKHSEGLPENELKEIKSKYISSFVSTIDTVRFIDPERYRSIVDTAHINNARFISFLNYRERQEEFNFMLNKQFKGDLHKFVTYWKEQYPK
ncbi:MAG: aminopeptidase [Cyclobacteriaceae bacterium]|nr:aminopeptidase [Cyclobacteriaceae bacterium]